MDSVRCAGDTLFKIESRKNSKNQRFVGRNEKRLGARQVTWLRAASIVYLSGGGSSWRKVHLAIMVSQARWCLLCM